MASILAGKLLILVVAFLILQVTAKTQLAAATSAAPQPRTRTIITKASDTHDYRRANPPEIQPRDEPEGADCSPEGQWNCMPDTWQRCAAGKWSQVMDLAEGTICTPEGLTENITIEHDGSVNGGDGGDGSGNNGGETFSGGARHGVAAGFAVAAGVFALL